jgi:hypothetical protein
MGGAAVLARKELSIKSVHSPGTPPRAAFAGEPTVDRPVFVVMKAAELRLMLKPYDTKR